MKKKELSSVEQQRLEEIETFMEISDDLPDGAFWALAEEKGIDASDLEWWGTITGNIRPCKCKKGGCK